MGVEADALVGVEGGVTFGVLMLRVEDVDVLLGVVGGVGPSVLLIEVSMLSMEAVVDRQYMEVLLGGLEYSRGLNS